MKVLSSGVDSLYVSGQGDLREGLLADLVEHRTQAAERGESEPWTFTDGCQFLMKPHGWRGYPYWLTSPRFEVFAGAAAPFPAVYLMLHSTFIHADGLEVAVEQVVDFLRSEMFADVKTVVASRVDVYADEQGWEPMAADFGKFVCRGVRRQVFEVPRQMHAHGRRFSGFTFGRGAILARIYDKTLELDSTGRTWPQLLWRDVDKSQPVWRIEFQFRRGALVTFGVRTLDDLMASRQDLWEYGMQWLSLRIPTAHHRQARWPEAEEWAALRRAEMGSPIAGLIRRRIREDNERRLVSGFVGYTSSLAAMDRDGDLDQALGRAGRLARGYLAQRGQEFRSVVAKKRERRLVI